MAALLVAFAGCGVPRWLWAPDDLAGGATAGPAGAPVVLVASRDSEFKRALADKLGVELAAAGFGQKVIGIGALAQTDLAPYHAVVIVGTCRAWRLEAEVLEFLERRPRPARLVLVTTSGDGAWLPDPAGQDYDAICSASIPASADAVAKQVVESIKSH